MSLFGLFLAILVPLPVSAQGTGVQAGVAAAVRGNVRLVALSSQADNEQAVGRNIVSGDRIFLGDKIETGPGAGLQIMLLDETIFTIGPNAAMVVDKFVYDPATDAGEVTASIVKGAFRFVSGRIAKRNPSDMNVRLPVATIGIRGTSVAGEVIPGVPGSPPSAEVILLGPGAENNADERAGRVVVDNAGSSVEISRPGFGTTIAGAEAPPSPPVRVPPTRIAALGGNLASTGGSNDGASGDGGDQNSGGSQGSGDSQDDGGGSSDDGDSGGDTGGGGSAGNDTGDQGDDDGTGNSSDGSGTQSGGDGGGGGTGTQQAGSGSATQASGSSAGGTGSGGSSGGSTQQSATTTSSGTGLSGGGSKRYPGGEYDDFRGDWRPWQRWRNGRDDTDGKQHAGSGSPYATLEQRANRIANLLLRHGCRPNSRVVLFTGKHADQYAGMLGALKAGGCWVPFTSAFPEERRRSLVASLKPCAVIVDPTTFDAALTMRAAGNDRYPIVLLGGEADDNDNGNNIYGETAIAGETAARPRFADATPDDLAYIICTSGSTGTPKGVMVRHRNSAHFLDRCPDLFGISEGRRFAHFSDLTFDPSVFDLFHAWATGGTVVPFNRRRYRIDPGLFLREQAINVLFCVPTAIATLAESGQIGRSEFASISHLLLTGEPVPPGLVRQWHAAYPDAALFNMYGTTETAIVSHCYRIPHDLDPAAPVPVGYAIDGMRVRLLNDDDEVADGDAGESVVSGPQLSPGYWNSPFQTAAAFVPDPLDPLVPSTVYRTGDRLRRDPDGLCHFVGRVDHQVKVRGHRVEPGEIEAALIRCDGVQEAAIVAVSPGERVADTRLVAFVKLEDGGDAEAVHRAAAETLPAWMVPSATLPVLQDFPRNPNGKIDRAALSRLALDWFSERHSDRVSRYGT